MTWHVNTALLHRYRLQQLSDARMASVEMHVTTCPSCRSLVAAEMDSATQAARDRVKDALEENLDAPPLGWVARALSRMGVNDRDAGLLAATLSLHGSWLAACVLALGFAAIATSTGPQGASLAAFLVVAPMVPLAAVALAYGPRVDPSYDIALAASVPTARIVLLRTLAVTVPALPVIVSLSFLLPGGLLAFAWLLPALGLATAGLALGTFMPMHRAVVGLAAGWALVAVLGFAEAPRTGTEAFVQGFAAFRPSGQLLSVAVTAASLVLLALRRAQFEAAR